MLVAPVVSVIIPAFNAEDYIVAAIESVVTQSMSQLEVIVIDDGSTDGTADKARSINDLRIRYMWQENCTQAVARNRGIELSKGEFIAFLDADDMWHPEKLKRQIELFDNENVGVTYTGAKYMDHDGNLKGRVPHVFARGFVLPELTKKNFISCSSVMVRRSILTKNNLQFRIGRQGAEDFDLWLRLALVTEFDYLKECLLLYRHHPQNISKNWDLMQQGQMRVFDDLSETIANLNLSHSQKYQLRKNCQHYRARQILMYAHWLLLQKRNVEAVQKMKESLHYNRKAFRTWWGLLKAFVLYG